MSRDIENYLYLVFNYSWAQLTDYPCYFDAPGRPSQWPSQEEYNDYVYNYNIYQDNSNSPSLLPDYTGILNPLRDVKGRCFKKFIAMKDYIQNVIGLDLSRIHFPNGEEPVYELPEEDTGE